MRRLCCSHFQFQQTSFSQHRLTHWTLDANVQLSSVFDCYRKNEDCLTAVLQRRRLDGQQTTLLPFLSVLQHDSYTAKARRNPKAPIGNLGSLPTSVVVGRPSRCRLSRALKVSGSG